MTTIRTVATHDVVRFVFPREPSELDELPRAIGRAIDGALSEYSHLAGTGRRPTATAMRRVAADRLDEELREVVAPVDPVEHERILTQIAGVLQAFRKSPVFGLPRPRSRLLLIDGTVGVYAQPDYWDPGRAIYEMKSYRSDPTPPDVALQLTVFQLAFAGLPASLLSIDRRADPIRVVLSAIAAPTSTERAAALEAARGAAGAVGQSKVLEYIENPIVPISSERGTMAPSARAAEQPRR